MGLLVRETRTRIPFSGLQESSDGSVWRNGPAVMVQGASAAEEVGVGGSRQAMYRSDQAGEIVL